MISRTSTRCFSERPSRSEDQTAIMLNSRRTAAFSNASNAGAGHVLGATDALVFVDADDGVAGTFGPRLEVLELAIGVLVVGGGADVDRNVLWLRHCCWDFLYGAVSHGAWSVPASIHMLSIVDG